MPLCCLDRPQVFGYSSRVDLVLRIYYVFRHPAGSESSPKPGHGSQSWPDMVSINQGSTQDFQWVFTSRFFFQWWSSFTIEQTLLPTVAGPFVFVLKGVGDGWVLFRESGLSLERLYISAWKQFACQIPRLYHFPDIIYTQRTMHYREGRGEN